MFNILLILVFVGGVVIAAVFAGVTFLQGLRSAQEIQITKQRLIETAARIQSQARYISGYIAPPQGSTGSSPYGYNQVPTWISSYARSASGVPFLYCPYAISDVSGTTASITVPSGSTYSIKYTNSTTTISQNYVTGGSTAPAGSPSNTIGLLVAAAPHSNQPPDCSSISTASDGTPIITGGIVVPIVNDYSNKMRMATSPTEFRIYVNSSASGDGTGRNTSNYATIATATALITSAKPAEVTMVFPAGTFTVCTDASTCAALLSYGGRVQLEGAAYNTTTFNATNLSIDETSILNLRTSKLSDSGTLTVYGQLQLDNADLSTTSGLKITGGEVKGYYNGRTINGNITIDGGGTFYYGNQGGVSITGLGNRGLSVTNGYLRTDRGSWNVNPTSANIVPVYIGAGGNLWTDGYFDINSNNSVNITGGMVIDPGGMFSFAGGGRVLGMYKATSYGIYDHGMVGFSGAGKMQIRNYATSYAVILASGASLFSSQNGGGTVISANSSTYRPGVTIYDNGAYRLVTPDSSATSVEANATGGYCWSGRSGTNLFSDPLSGTNTGDTNGHLSYTNNSTGIKWLRFYNQSYLQCVK